MALQTHACERVGKRRSGSGLSVDGYREVADAGAEVQEAEVAEAKVS